MTQQMISADAIRGYVDLMVLSILCSGPSYAYELVQRIGTTSEGSYSIKQTTLYTAVKRLEQAALVSSYPGESATGKARTYYQITPEGRAHLIEKIAEWEQTKTVIDRFIEGATA